MQRGFDENKQKAIIHNLQLWLFFFGDCCMFDFDNCAQTKLAYASFLCGRHNVCCVVV